MRTIMVRGLLQVLIAMSLAACASHAPWGHAVEVRDPAPAARQIAITISEHGFEPDRIEAATGEEVELVFTRRVAHTCVTRVVLSLDADRRIERELPRDQPVVVRLTFDRPGELGFSCPMGMYAGVIEIR